MISPRSAFFGTPFLSVFSLSFLNPETGGSQTLATWDYTLLLTAAEAVGRLRQENARPKDIEKILIRLQTMNDKGVRLLLAGAAPVFVAHHHRTLALTVDAELGLPVSLLATLDRHREHCLFFTLSKNVLDPSPDPADPQHAPEVPPGVHADDRDAGLRE